jgi:hypothetical protein
MRPVSPSVASFGVLYVGADPHCCFIELRFVDLASSGGLTHIGADARLVTGSYKIAQRWSASLRFHPSKPDGIRYPARHDPTRVAYAIFTRPRSAFIVTSLGSLMAPSNRTLLNQLLRDYNVDLI